MANLETLLAEVMAAPRQVLYPVKAWSELTPLCWTNGQKA
jgi:hypothetical protein